MKRLLTGLLIIVLVVSCRLLIPVPNGIPAGAELVKGVNDPVTVVWDYIPEEGVSDYSFDFLMVPVSTDRLGSDIVIIGNTTALEYNFTVSELNVTEPNVLGVRAVEHGVPSSAIWSDLSTDTAGGTFYVNQDGLWVYNAPSNIRVR